MPQAVYPRVYGGTTPATPRSTSQTGLSPRVRGNPSSGRQSGRFRAVYPRVYGGTETRFLTRTENKGLSPRVRGNPPGAILILPDKRSIPACTGEPPAGIFLSRATRVYPRVYGGTPRRRLSSEVKPGLSPRVRGNPPLSRDAGRYARSIPACTGEPRAPPQTPRSKSVYPRVYGGTQGPCLLPAPAAGLSPRVRGNRNRSKGHFSNRGSIPACTGEPGCHHQRPGDAQVYPRVYGGTGRCRTRSNGGLGLSPRVRGNLEIANLHPVRTRSIPACTGEP